MDEKFEKIDNTKVVDIQVKDELEKSFISYAMAVNISRAIPDVRDGMKPVHRRILYAMNELGLTPDKPYKKCATVVGHVLGKYHPHGDSSVYDALVRLAQDFSINLPLVDGHGNFGSVDGDSAAAYRYTEARMSKVALEMLRDIDKDTVDTYPNFDETCMQPVVLPSRFPNLLVNGSDGIAVGMATNVPPHNLAEVIDGVVAMIEDPEIDIEELIKIIPGPDFPTRGLILGRSGIKQSYRTGKGSFIIRSRAEIEEMANGRSRIIVSEIPYQVNKSRLIIQMADLVKNKKIEGISDIKDESDREGLRIVIDVKRDANAQVVLNMLYKHTQMQISFGAIFLALANGTPKILNLKEILTYYLDFQKSVIVRRTQFDLDKAEAKAHILEGLMIAQANIDEVIKTIKQSDDKNDAMTKLISRFELSEKQAAAILEMRLQKLTGLEVEKLKEDLDGVHQEIKHYKEVLGNERLVLDIIKNDLLEIKTKYGVPRKSEISFDYGDIDIADLIAEEQVVISTTHGGYIKRIAVAEYKSQHRGGRGVIAHKTKEEDFVENIYITSTHDDLMCFSNMGKVYTIKAYEVPEAERTGKGRAMINLLQLSAGERITTIIPMKEETTGNLLMATKQGLIKKTNLEEFANIRRSGKIAIRLAEDDELIGVYITSGNDEVIMASSSGKCIRFNENTVRTMGRDTMGVKSMRIAPGESVVDMSIVKKDSIMLTISEYGYGKRSKEDEYRLQGRYGSGIKAGVFDEKTGNLVNLKQVTENDDIMLIADDGVVIRIKATEISLIGRNTKGVRVMKTNGNSKIVCVAVTPSEEAEEELAESLHEEEIIDSLPKMDMSLDSDEFEDVEIGEKDDDDAEDEDEKEESESDDEE